MPFVFAAVVAFAAAHVVLTAVVLSVALSLGVQALVPKPKTTNAASQQRLSTNLDVNAARKIIFGHTALGMDERYWECYGATGYDQIVVHATHPLTSIQSMYIEGNGPLTFDGSGNATGSLTITNGDGTTTTVSYAGVLKWLKKLVGVTGTNLACGYGTIWTTAASLTGCAYSCLKWTVDQQKLPNGVPSQIVIVGDGTAVYDPRKDTTVGGSGSHRANDQTTWAYSTLDSNSVPIGRNNALQVLRYLLGWRIQSPQTSAWTLVDGRGVDPADINYADFIQAANDCETAQFYTDGILSTTDSHSQNEGILAAGAGGVLHDPGGLWSYKVAVDDTSNIAVAFTDDDIISAAVWNPRDSIVNQYNEVVGTFTDPSAGSLYRQLPYPSVKSSTFLTQDNNIESRLTLDLQFVQDATLAQNLAWLALNKSRYSGTFKATFNYKALQAINYNCVTVTFAPLGWTNKLFRVVDMILNPDGGVDLTLREEASAAYTIGAIGSYTPPPVGTQYNITQVVPVSGLAVAAVSVNSDGTAKVDGLSVSWTAPPGNVRWTEVQYKRHSDSIWLRVGDITHDITSVLISPVQPGTSYDVQARTVSLNNVFGAWSLLTVSSGSNTTATQNQIFVQNTDPTASTTVNDGALWTDTSVTPNLLKTRIGGVWVASANYTTNTNQLTDGAGLGTTAQWPNITGSGKPANNASVGIGLARKSSFSDGLL